MTDTGPTEAKVEPPKVRLIRAIQKQADTLRDREAWTAVDYIRHPDDDDKKHGAIIASAEHQAVKEFMDKAINLIHLHWPEAPKNDA